MIRNFFKIFLCAMLLCGMLMPAALASAEPPAEELSPAEPGQETAAEAETGQELMAPVAAADALSPAEDWQNPEDPLYEKMMNQPGLDGAARGLWTAMPSFADFSPRERERETVHPGIDVSVWQKTIDWKKVAAAGVEFAFVRVAYRGSTVGALQEDGNYKINLEGAKAAGLQVGVYIYSQAITVEEAAEEAAFLLERIEKYDVDLPVVFDYEYSNGGRLQKAELTNRQRTDICLAFCQAVEAAGYDSMVYANANMLNNDLYAGELPRVWLAHFTKETAYAGEYEFWQCYDQGQVDGISGSVDLDFWFRPGDGTENSAPNPFTDVQEKDWFYASVTEAYKTGIVTGITATTFAPNAVARRGQVVTMLHRIMGKPAAAAAANFKDLTEEYYKTAVAWAAEQGIVQGVSDTAFAPNGVITRQDLVTMLYRLENSPAAKGDLTAFSDSGSVRDYARGAMSWAVEQGIITGYEDNTLRPQKSATRAEVCAILMRYTELKAAA